MTVAVIGAGASGMMAALLAARRGAAVTLFERNSQVGRKLLVSGSGRCNITNAAAAAPKYACADPAWLDTLFSYFGVDDLLGLLGEIGIAVYHTPDGWYYPRSDSAQTVVDAFASALQIAGVRLRAGAQATGISRSRGGFNLRIRQDGPEKDEFFERVIVSAGGKAYPSLGTRGELFPALEQVGHTVLPKRPALAPLLVDLGPLHELQGVRLDAGVTLYEGKACLAAASGNLIFTQFGINGPAVMDVSYQVSARPSASLTLALDLLDFHRREFNNLLGRLRSTPAPVRVLLGAFFPPKVGALYLRLAKLPADARLDQIEDRSLDRLVASLQDTRLAVKGVRDFEYCQVSAGGVPVTEVDPQTLESRRVPGLYLTGETLDVVGPCGGYNLQFAFSSGALAGLAASK
jgi:predicted Rossmann fold flavoprotein